MLDYFQQVCEDHVFFEPQHPERQKDNIITIYHRADDAAAWFHNSVITEGILHR
jgi:hypothetical protein